MISIKKLSVLHIFLILHFNKNHHLLMNFTDILNKIVNSTAQYSHRNAFCIAEKYITYNEFSQSISNIRNKISKIDDTEKVIGVITNDDLDTYSTLIALWLEGRAYVPINPLNPIERNLSIIKQANVKSLFNSSIETENLYKTKIIYTSKLQKTQINLSFKESLDNELAYILFTSGSTGVPKGVPITRGNLASFMDSVEAMQMDFSENDRFLQMFDLTFDLSVWSFLQPLCVGATIYTIPQGEIKYMYAYSLLEEHDITVALMVPSMLSFLRPFLEDVELPKLRYSLFCGEALHADTTIEWSKSVRNARIFNVYGPTEATIFCTQYEVERDKKIIANNGIVSIGKQMKNIVCEIIDENNKPVKVGEKGELCLSGTQLTYGYLDNENLNKTAFIKIGNKIYYKTGDLCYIDENKLFMYCGRTDNQIKIQGYRVELSEIEYNIREYNKSSNVAAVATNFENGTSEIHVFVDNINANSNDIISFTKEKLPAYMVPKKVHIIKEFPLNSNGKIDRKELQKMVTDSR